MDLEQITAALSENAELLTGVITHVLDTDKGKEIITNRADGIYNERIGDEVSGIHRQYDEDMFSILGERPGTIDGGGKQKTYDKIKSLYEELNTLRGQKETLSKDAEVQRLTAEIENLKTNGPGAHWEQTFNTEKEKWTTERQTLLERAENAEGSITTFKKRSDIEAGLRGFKYNESVPDGVRKTYVDNVVNSLIQQSKVEGDKVIYLDENGAQINDAEYKPMSAQGILKMRLKDILLDANADGGGGAPATVKGSIETTSIDGKNVDSLKLVDGSFKTRVEFLETAEKALLDSGITRDNPQWDKLKNEAYNRYNVKDLPLN